MRLFDTDEKIGVFCETYKPGIEKRRGEEIKVLDLTLMVQPLTPEDAATITAGDGAIKAELFNASDGEIRPNIRAVAFDVAVPRQTLTIYASPDTVLPSIALTQAKVGKLRARIEKGVNAWGLVFHAAVGPLGKVELEFVHRWKGTQMFVTFEESEPMLDEEDDQDGLLADADEKAQTVVNDGPIPPEPMWTDDEEDAAATTAIEQAAQELGQHYPRRHGAKKKSAQATKKKSK